jgi:CheY-like chemotaxis protein
MILFVDDERRYVENVLEELALLGVEVRFCPGIDEALSAVGSCQAEIDAIVCDVMMPHGTAFTAPYTEQNRITGLRFLARVREMGFKGEVVLLTYLEPGRAPVDEEAAKFPPCRVIRKREKWSFEIAEMISLLVKHG